MGDIKVPVNVQNELIKDYKKLLGYLSANGIPLKEIVTDLQNSEEFHNYVHNFIVMRYPEFELFDSDDQKSQINSILLKLNQGVLTQSLVSDFSKLCRSGLIFELWAVRRGIKELELQLKNIANSIYFSGGLDEEEGRRIRAMESAAAILLKVLIAREKSLMVERKELEEKTAGTSGHVDLSLETVDAPLPELEP